MTRLDVALVERGLFASRAKAREAIEAGLVTVDGAPARKPALDVGAQARIEAGKPYPWVSRGGVKLAAALDAFAIDPSGLVCLDVGASTGGFTQVLLSRGAARVYAVDVGHGQLHAEVACDPRVVSLEGRDSRDLTTDVVPEAPDLIVCDVSFISLRLALPAALALASSAARLITLVKPQFEAGRGAVARGVVRDPAVHARVCEAAQHFVQEAGWTLDGLIPSPIEGGDGNREFLLAAHRSSLAPATRTR